MKQMFGVAIPNAGGGERVLALFSTPAGAHLYQETILQRQAYTPRWQRQSPVRGADVSPPVAGSSIRTTTFLLDAPIEDLPGAWTAVVNKEGRLVDYWFSFEVAPSTPGHLGSSATGTVAIGHAATPGEAFHNARTCLYPRQGNVHRSQSEPVASEDPKSVEGAPLQKANPAETVNTLAATLPSLGCRIRS